MRLLHQLALPLGSKKECIHRTGEADQEVEILILSASKVEHDQSEADYQH